MRYLLLLLLLLITSCSEKTIRDGESFLKDVSGLKLITGKIEDKDLIFIVDSGAKTTTIDKKAADELDIKYFETEDFVHGIGGSSKIYTTSNFDLKILNDTIPFRANVTDLSAVVKAFKKLSYTVHGILGSDFLIRNGCIIDYPQNKLICRSE